MECIREVLEEQNSSARRRSLAKTSFYMFETNDQGAASAGKKFCRQVSGLSLAPARKERFLSDKALPAFEELEDFRCRIIGYGGVSKEDASGSRSLVSIKPSTDLIRMGRCHHGKTRQHFVTNLG